MRSAYVYAYQIHIIRCTSPNRNRADTHKKKTGWNKTMSKSKSKKGRDDKKGGGEHVGLPLVAHNLRTKQSLSRPYSSLRYRWVSRGLCSALIRRMSSVDKRHESWYIYTKCIFRENLTELASWFVIFLSWIATLTITIHAKIITNRDFFVR